MSSASPPVEIAARPVLRDRLRWAAERLIAVPLALLLLRSAFAHLGNPYLFLSTVYSYELTGKHLGEWVAVVLPYWQMTAACCLLGRWWPRAVYGMLALTFAIFGVAQYLVLRRGLAISCGCFGAGDSMQVSTGTLAFTAGCTLAVILGCFLAADLPSSRKPVPGETSQP
jgi:hypothetical protein